MGVLIGLLLIGLLDPGLRIGIWYEGITTTVVVVLLTYADGGNGGALPSRRKLRTPMV